jgi:hypothetical protein
VRRHPNVHVSLVPVQRVQRWWQVRRGGRTVSRHRTQAAALRAACHLARRRRADVVTHGRGGRIRSKDSYGTETRRRDREH